MSRKKLFTMRVLISKFKLLQKAIMAGLMGVLRDAKGLGMGRSYL